jgi:hypothetical protein
MVERNRSAKAGGPMTEADMLFGEYYDGKLTLPVRKGEWWTFTETIVYRFKTEEEARQAHRQVFMRAMKRGEAP